MEIRGSWNVMNRKSLHFPITYNSFKVLNNIGIEVAIWIGYQRDIEVIAILRILQKQISLVPLRSGAKWKH